MAKKKLGSFKELAVNLGISPNQLSNILSNKFDPIKSNVNEVASFLGVNPLKLLMEVKEHADI